jgi:hypothetical protein
LLGSRGMAAQFLVLAVVMGSYLAAQYMRAWRPRRRGRQPARFASRIPDRSVPETSAT